jgi:hypothetical protein
VSAAPLFERLAAASPAVDRAWRARLGPGDGESPQAAALAEALIETWRQAVDPGPFFAALEEAHLAAGPDDGYLLQECLTEALITACDRHGIARRSLYGKLGPESRLAWDVAVEYLGPENR